MMVISFLLQLNELTGIRLPDDDDRKFQDGTCRRYLTITFAIISAALLLFGEYSVNNGFIRKLHKENCS